MLHLVLLKSITEVMKKTRMYGKVSNTSWAHLLLFIGKELTITAMS